MTYRIMLLVELTKPDEALRGCNHRESQFLQGAAFGSLLIFFAQVV